MQTLTFTQKLLRQRRFLSSLIPLFALFVGLGASQKVQAQSSVASSSVSVTTTQSGVTNTASYDTQASTVGPTNFFNRDFGTFNLSSDAFVLNGGTIAINEDPAELYDQGELLFRVFPGTLATVTAPSFISIPLVNNGVSGGVRTFSLSAANQNLLTNAVAGSAAPGTSNRFDVRFRISYNNVSGEQILSPIRRSVFTSVGSPTPPSNIGGGSVYINTTNSTSPNTTYTAPDFDGENLGPYDINTGGLTLNGGIVTTFERNGEDVSNVRLIYQIVKPAQNGQSSIVFPSSSIALQPTTNTTTDANGNTTREFANSTALRNLISGLANSGIGNFNITIRFEADVVNAAGSVTQIVDNNGGPGYTATFSTTGVPILTNTWTGNFNDNWFDARNWDLNRLPDANTNVIVPDFGPGNTKPYPNINANVQVFSTAAVPVLLYDNTGSGDAVTRNLNLLGSTQAQRTILRLVDGRLRVFGDFVNNQDSFIQRTGSVFELAGVNQSFTGGSNFDRVEISGGGVKVLTGTMIVAGSFAFVGTGGVVTTDVSRVNSNFIQFGDRSQSAPNGAQLEGENEASYIRGFVFTNRSSVQANETVNGLPDPRTFGNLGMTLFFKGPNNPGDVLVTRNTAESHTPLISTPTGTSARYGIRRIFGVRPGSPNTNNGGLLADLTFRYRDAELVNLGPDGAGSIAEPNLGLFVSQSGGNQFGFLGVDDLQQGPNILTKLNVRTFATFTLGDRTRPLPVSLIAFEAKRVNNDALITWQTASEQNSRGYDVQVSTNNGETFRTLGFVASVAPNSVRPLSYSFVDVERNKSGQRYYRLRQVDVDGKETFFAPRLVNFEGTVADDAMAAYPNPFATSDVLHLTLKSAVAGDGQVRITDMTGRLVSQQTLSIATGSNDVTLSRLEDLKAGLYQVHVVLPSGDVQSLKVMKK